MTANYCEKLCESHQELEHKMWRLGAYGCANSMTRINEGGMAHGTSGWRRINITFLHTGHWKLFDISRVMQLRQDELNTQMNLRFKTSSTYLWQKTWPHIVATGSVGPSKQTRQTHPEVEGAALDSTIPAFVPVRWEGRVSCGGTSLRLEDEWIGCSEDLASLGVSMSLIDEQSQDEATSGSFPELLPAGLCGEWLWEGANNSYHGVRVGSGVSTSSVSDEGSGSRVVELVRE